MSVSSERSDVGYSCSDALNTRKCFNLTFAQIYSHQALIKSNRTLINSNLDLNSSNLTLIMEQSHS